MTAPVLLEMGCAERSLMVAKKPRLEEQFDPLTLEDDDIWEEVSHLTTTTPETTTSIRAEKPAVEDTSQAKEIQYVQGFRVQIFASLNRQRALEAKQYAESLLNEKVYLEFEAPFYKVRVGDCLSSTEAEALLKRIRKRGYPDAFKVRTTIRVPSER